jgi:hypothetical protein
MSRARPVTPNPGLQVPQRPPIERPPVTTPPTQSIPPPAKATRETVREPREILIPRSASGLHKTIVLGGPVLVGPKVIYARAFTAGGTPVDLGGGLAEILWMIVHVAEPPVQSIHPWMDGVPMSVTTPGIYTGRDGKIIVWTFSGAQTSLTSTGLDVFDPDAAAEEIHTGEDALAVIRADYHADLNPNLPDFQFEVRGYADVLDTRTATRGYSTNTAAVIREFLTNQTWGMRDPAVAADALWNPELEYCDEGAFMAAPTAPASAVEAGAGDIEGGLYWYVYTLLNADGAETTASPAASVTSVNLDTSHSVTIPIGAAGTASRRLYRGTRNAGSTGAKYLVAEIPDNTTTAFHDTLADGDIIATATRPPTRQPKSERYSIALAMDEQSAARNWLDTLRSHCVAALLLTNGRWRLSVDRPDAAPRPAFTETDGAGGQAIGNVDVDSVETWRKDRDELFNACTVWFVDVEDGHRRKPAVVQRPGIPPGQERMAVYELRGITEGSMATRLATLLLNLAWNDLYIRFRTGRQGIGLEPRDVVAAWAAGLVGQDFRVEVVETGTDDSVTITALEYQPAAYLAAVLPVDEPVATGGG